MVKKKTKKILNVLLLAPALLIIFGTHIRLLTMGFLPQGLINQHATINLLAGVLIVIYLFLQRSN